MSEQSYVPINGGTENRSDYGTITRDSEGVLRNPDGTVWSPLSTEQVAFSWKLYVGFLFSLFLLWQGYEWSSHLPHKLPKGRETPDFPFEGESNFMVDTEAYNTLSVIVNTTAAITNIQILTNGSEDTKSIHITSAIFTDDSRNLHFKQTTEEDRYILALNSNGADVHATATIQIVLPASQLSLNNLDILLATGTVNGSALTHSQFDKLNVKVDEGTITFKDVRGSHINLQTSIGDITGTFSIDQMYSAISNQGHIDCRLRVPAHSTPDISLGTSVGNVTARVTDTFRGPFSLFTKRGHAYVFGSRYIDFFTNTTTAKNGVFREDNADSNISMYSQQGRVVLAFKRNV
ncbi:hypothetical protein K7432_008982 [Basidiobolus ranarum]|uniref:Adhesin domain-containing protein n=1 Tax=Basidiobolus ranarum TaxID=34480 RepID=A0ABR2VXS3_9FUNG